MEKGILHIKRKPRHILSEGREIQIKKELPEIGKQFDKLECEFEGNPATKILVDGQWFNADLKALEEKKSRKQDEMARVQEYERLMAKQRSGDDSFCLEKAQIPRDTKSCLIHDGDNFNLKLNRFARYEFKNQPESEKKFQFFSAKAFNPKNEFDQVPAFRIKANFGNLFSQKETQLADKQFHAAQNIYNRDGHLLVDSYVPEWRFILGLGGSSVYETDIALHHIYGIPYIPASSIKGVLRTWIIFSEFNNHEDQAVSKSKEFCEIFGCPSKSFFNEARQGLVTFFDAFPIKEPVIEPDIMNPHYPKWYSGKKGEKPVDTDKPNPVFFLTVKHTPFQFLVGSQTWNLKIKLFWGKTLGEWLNEALGEHGLGAKTAVGYGYFKKND